MSTKVTIRHLDRAGDLPGFHVYEDVLDALVDEDADTPVYLELEGVAVKVETLSGGGASIAVVLPRGVARALGLLPASAHEVGKQ